MEGEGSSSGAGAGPSYQMPYEQTPLDEEHGDDAGELIDAETVEVLEDNEMAPVDSDDDDAGAEGEGEDAEEDAVAAPGVAPVADESVVQWRGHAGAVYTLAACPADPALLASGGGDDKAFLWRMDSGAQHKELLGHRDTVDAVGFSHDGVLLATAGLDGIVAVWNVADGSLACTVEGPSEAINWLAWHQRGHVLLVGSEDTTCWMWKVPEGECMQIFAAHAASVTCGAFSGDGKAIVTGSDDATVRVWNPRTGQVVHCLQSGTPAAIEEADGAVSCIASHATSPVALVGLVDGRVNLVQLEKGTVLASWYEHRACVEGVGFCTPSAANLPLAASAGLDGVICIWDTNTLAMRHRCALQDGMSALRWHPTMPFFVTAGLDGVARVWDSRSGTEVRAFTGHTQRLLDAMLVPVATGETAVVTSSDDHTARVFRLPP